jgi:hypothetical protein
MKKRVVLISFSLLMTLPAAMVAAEKAGEPGTGDQRAACDAQCRDNYQNNAVALEACLRDCGAVGPASPAGAMAIGHEAPHTAQQATKVKGSKSNTSERLASPATPPPAPVESANLNLSKSNINSVTPPAAGAPSVEATTVKGSKSNSDNRMAQPSSAGAPVAEATKVKSSKSNSSDRQLAPDTGETPPVEPVDDVPSDG